MFQEEEEVRPDIPKSFQEEGMTVYGFQEEGVTVLPDSRGERGMTVTVSRVRMGHLHSYIPQSFQEEGMSYGFKRREGRRTADHTTEECMFEEERGMIKRKYIHTYSHTTTQLHQEE